MTQEKQHTGVGDVDGVPYSYEHADDLDGLEAIYELADGLYRIEAYVALADRPVHKNVYFVPGERLDRWLSFHHEVGSVITDIRPCTASERDEHLSDYR